MLFVSACRPSSAHLLSLLCSSPIPKVYGVSQCPRYGLRRLSVPTSLHLPLWHRLPPPFPWRLAEHTARAHGLVSPAGTGSRHGRGPSVLHTCRAVLATCINSEVNELAWCLSVSRTSLGPSAHGPSPPGAAPLRASRPRACASRPRACAGTRLARSTRSVSTSLPVHRPPASRPPASESCARRAPSPVSKAQTLSRRSR